MAPELLTVPPRTEHDTRTVSRHRRTGVDIVGIVVVVDGAVAVEVIRTAIFGVARAGNIRVVAGRRWWEAGRLRLPDRCERRDQQRQHHGVSPQHQLRAGHMHFANTPDFSPTLARANTFKTGLRPRRFTFGRSHAGKLRVRASTGGLIRRRMAAPRGGWSRSVARWQRSCRPGEPTGPAIAGPMA